MIDNRDEKPTNWATIGATLCARYGARPRWRRGNNRGWWIPHPAGGNLTAEVTLRRRWCSLAIDRWHTTDRDPDIARPWLEANVWPAVRAACQARRNASGVLPTGNKDWTSANPIDRADLLDLLVSWLDAELTWSVAPTQPTSVDTRPCPTHDR